MKKIIYFLIVSLFITCKIEEKENITKEIIENLKNNNKINVKEITLKKTNVFSNEIKSIISNDSVQILDYKKLGEELYMEENCTIIDYRNNTSLKSIMGSYTLSYLLNEINSGEYVYKNTVKLKKENTFNILENTYFRLYSYKNNLVNNSTYVYYPIYLNNNSITFTYMDGIDVSYFSKIEKTKKGTFIFHLNEKNFYEIKIIDKNSMVQIWKDQNNSYILLAPLKTTLKLPVLETIYKEMDYEFQDFDTLNLEQIFNSESK